MPVSDDLDVLARHLVAMAELDDGIVTDLLEVLVRQAGGVLVGLDHRIKSLDSLKRKLTDMLALDPDLQLDQAAERVYDALRFTVVAEPSDYTEGLDALLSELPAPGRHPGRGCKGSGSARSSTMKAMSVVFCASSLGGPEPHVLARFVTDGRGLHPERFDRREGRWIQDARVSGYLTGHDDWAERITPAVARQLIKSWGYAADVLKAPVAEVAST